MHAFPLDLMSSATRSQLCPARLRTSWTEPQGSGRRQYPWQAELQLGTGLSSAGPRHREGSAAKDRKTIQKGMAMEGRLALQLSVQADSAQLPSLLRPPHRAQDKALHSGSTGRTKCEHVPSWQGREGQAPPELRLSADAAGGPHTAPRGKEGKGLGQDPLYSCSSQNTSHPTLPVQTLSSANPSQPFTGSLVTDESRGFIFDTLEGSQIINRLEGSCPSDTTACSPTCPDNQEKVLTSPFTIAVQESTVFQGLCCGLCAPGLLVS